METTEPREIELSRDKVALVSPEDYTNVARFKWSATVIKYYSQRKNTIIERWYAVRFEKFTAKRKTVYMHRFLTNAEKGVVIDHIDGDGLNNTRCNLRRTERKTPRD